MSSDYIDLSSLEETEIAALLAQLDLNELKRLERIHIKTGDRDTRIIARKLSQNMNFTLATKIQLHYNVH